MYKFLCGYIVFNSLEYTQNIDLGIELLSHMVTKKLLIDFSQTISQTVLVFYNFDSFEEYHAAMGSTGIFLMLFSLLDLSNVFVDEVIFTLSSLYTINMTYHHCG